MTRLQPTARRLIARATRSLRRTAGAIDLASILVGVLVMGVLGSVIAASVFVVIPWAQDNAAKASLDGVKTAQSVSRVKDGKYQDWAGLLASKYVTGSAAIDTVVNATGDCYVSATKSGSGTSFYKTSRDATVLDDKAGPPDTSWCVNSTQLLADPVVNLLANPSFESAAAGTTVVRTNLHRNPRAVGTINGFTSWDGSSNTNSTAVAAQALSASGSAFRATWTTTATNQGDIGVQGYWPLVGAVGAQRVTITAMVVASRTQTISGAYGYSATAGSWTDVVRSPAQTFTAGVPTRIYLTADATAAASGDFRAIMNPAAKVAGDTFDIFDADVYTGDYQPNRAAFSGDTPAALGMTYGWAGAANASASTVKSTAVSVRTNLLTNPSFEGGVAGWYGPNGSSVTASGAQARTGSQSNLVTLTTYAGASNNGAGTTVALAAATTYTFSAYVYVPAATPAVDIQVQGASFATVRGSKSTAKDTWQRISVTFASTTAQSYALYVLSDAASTAGQTLYVDSAVLEEGVAAGPYFDGGITDTPDFANAWTGAANNSPSIQQAAKVWGLTGNYVGRAAWQSSVWAASGRSSVAVAGARPTVDSFTQFDTAFIPGPLAGRTFTVAAKLRTEESYPAGADGRAWSYHVVYNLSGGGTGYIIARPATTGAGVHDVQRTFTFPADATSIAFVRFYNGSPNNSPVYWDDAMLVEGEYTGTYFDGDSVNGVWDGAAHASTSTGYIRR